MSPPNTKINKDFIVNYMVEMDMQLYDINYLKCLAREVLTKRWRNMPLDELKEKYKEAIS